MLVEPATCSGYLPCVTLATMLLEPPLPAARGPLSMAVLQTLRERAPRRRLNHIDASLAASDPCGLDLQLALFVCYELHYRGFAGVDPRWEWNPGLLHLRGLLEDDFLSAVRRDVGEIEPEATAAAEMDALSVEPLDGEGPSYYLRDEGSWEQMREYFVHRSIFTSKGGIPPAGGSHPRLGRHRQR